MPETGLWRVAELVARDAPQTEVFVAIADAVRRSLNEDLRIVRCAPHRMRGTESSGAESAMRSTSAVTSSSGE